MEVEVVQETPLTPHSEHSYSKLFDGIEPVEEEKMDTGGSPMLSSLDAAQDTFETFLLLLLKSFTSQQHQDSGTSLPAGDHADISVEALDTLSSEQVQVLTTSSSVNYDTINQIRQRQQARSSSPSKPETNSSEAVEPSDPNTSVAPTAMEESGTADSQLQQIQKFQVTPEQLKQLELQVTELLQSQKVVLPSDITPEQQQEVIQALLLRQLRLQQASTRGASGENSNGGGNSMIVGLLQGEGEVQGQERSEGKQEAAVGPSKETSTGTQTLSTSTATKPSTSTRGRKKEQETRKEPKKPPMPYNLFFSEVYSTVLAANPKMGFSEASKIISMMWNAMGSDAKQRYFSKHDELKQEYKAAMEKHLAANKKAAELEAKMDTKIDTKIDMIAMKMQTGSEVHEARSVEGPVDIKLEPNTEVGGRGDAQQDMETGETIEPKDPNLCARVGCSNAAVFAEERGPRYCSNKCVIEHCRQVFNAWPAQRKVQT